MSDVDQRPGGIRLRRLLTRALAVAGTTAAGASLAWALGSGVAVAAEHTSLGDVVPAAGRTPVTTGPAGSGAPGCAPGPAGAAQLRHPERALLEPNRADPRPAPASLILSATGSASDGPSGATHPCARAEGASTQDGSRGVVPAVDRVTGSVGAVLDSAEPVLEPVERLGDAVLSGSDGRGALPGVIGELPGTGDVPGISPGRSGRQPGDPGQPEFPGQPGSPGRVGGHDGSTSEPAAGAPEAPALPADPAGETGPAVSADRPALSAASGEAVRGLGDHAPGDRREPGRLPALPPAMPAPAPVSCGPDGHLTSGHGSANGVSLTSHAAQRTYLAGSCVAGARSGAPALPGGPRPQPGVTPD